MKTILTKKGESILVDDDVYLWASQFNWHVTNERSYKYAVTGSRNKLHRIIMQTMNQPTLLVDHINGDGLDNRRENLRVCDTRLNLLNQKVRSNNTTGYKGVHKLKTNGRYMAYCSINNKRMYLGIYKTPEEAAVVYNEAAKRLHGEFARLNVI